MVRGRLIAEPAATPPDPQMTPHDLDQAAVGAFNSNLNALNIIVGSFTPTTNTPHNADQVFTAIFNRTSNAIQVNCVSGCGAGNGTVNNGASGLLAYYPATGTAVSGSANASISNGTLALGTNGTAPGALALANSATGGATVTLQNLGASSAYNFNLPATPGTSGQCLQSGGGGNAPSIWGPCGAGGNPGGNSGQIQYNNANSFGGFTLAGDCTLSVPNIVCTRTNGTAFATSATTDATNASNISSGTLAAGRLPSGVVQTNQSNTFSTGAQDFSAATSVKVPVKAGATTPANGQIAYDSTANVPHMAVASADAKVATFTAAPGTGNCVKWISGTQVGDQGAACGSVTSVGLALPAIFAVSGSPVTGGGTLTGTLSSQTANTFFAGPNGSAGTPTFRAIAPADVPTLNQNTSGNAATATALAGTPTLCTSGQAAQGILANGSATGCFTPNGSMVYPVTGIPLSTGSAWGTSLNETDNNMIAGVSGAWSKVATLPTALFPTLTGDVTNAAGSLSTTVGRVNGAALPASKTIVGTNSSGQLVDATSATLTNNTSGNAATATALATLPGQCTGNNFATGIAASGTANCSQPAFSNLSGSLAAAQTPLTTLGDILYVNSTPALARLPGNTTSTRNFLVETGTGTASAPPAWGTLASGDLPATIASNTSGNAATATALAGSPGQCTGGQFATGITANGTANCSTPTPSGGLPGGSNTAVQYNSSGSFGGDVTNFAYNATTHSLTLTGPISASSFVSTGTAPGSTSWSSGAMSAGGAGTVNCGANTGNVFSCSDNGGPVFAVPFIAGDIGGTQTTPAVTGINGTAVPASKTIVGTNSSGQIIDATGTTLPTAMMPALTGDVTNTAGNLATTVGKVNGGTLPASKAIVGTNASGQIIDATSATLTNNTSGNAATATALAATPTGCTTGQYASSIAASGNLGCAQVAYAQVSGTPSSLPPSGSASGDLSGSYPGPAVAAIKGVSVPTLAAGYLHYTGSAFSWDTPSGSGAPGGSANQLQYMVNGTTFGGLTGSSVNPSTGAITIGGALTAPSFTSTGTGPFAISGTEGAYSSGCAPTVDFLYADSTNHAFTACYNNGTRYVVALSGGDLTNNSGLPKVTGLQGAALPSLSSGYLHYNGSSLVFDTPSGSMIYPGAGIANSTGSAWGTSYSSTSQIPGNFVAVMGASGTTHAPGAVPDPGSTAGTTHYLREDGTWQVPTASGAVLLSPAAAQTITDASGTNLTIANQAVGDVPLIVNGITGQTGNLANFDVNGVVKSSVGSGGGLNLGGNIVFLNSGVITTNAVANTITISTDSSAGATSVGLLGIGGANGSGTGNAGSVSVHGGNNTAASSGGAGGNVNIAAGTSTSGAQGVVNLQESANSSGTIAIGDLVVVNGTYQVADVAAGGLAWSGIATATSGAQNVVTAGIAPSVNFDAATVTAGDYACAPPASTGTAGKLHDNGATQCPAGQAVGMVWKGGSSSVGDVLLHTGSAVASSGGTGTVTDGSGVTTANELAVSTTTAHTQTYASTLPTAAMPALTGDVTNTAGSLATTVGKINGGTVGNSWAFPVTNASGQLVQGVGAISFTIGDVTNSSALTTSELAYFTVPRACAISGYDLMIDTGTITVKFLKVATGTALPTLASNSISTSGVSIASGTGIHSTTTSDFTTTAVSAFDIMGVAITAVSNAHYLTAEVECK